MMHTVKKNMYHPTSLHLNEWLSKKTKTHERLSINSAKTSKREGSHGDEI